MADIREAAQWMKQGKRVRRPRLDKSVSIGAKPQCWIRVYEFGRISRDNRTAPFDVEDLLADDWEIAE